jgi:hypothetical protein
MIEVTAQVRTAFGFARVGPERKGDSLALDCSVMQQQISEY